MKAEKTTIAIEGKGTVSGRERRRSSVVEILGGLQREVKIGGLDKCIVINSGGIEQLEISGGHIEEAGMRAVIKYIRENMQIRGVNYNVEELSSGAVGLLDELAVLLLERNREYQKFASDYVHILLSAHCSSSVKIGEKLEGELAGWQVMEVVDDIKQSGYYGVIYVNKSAGQVVLAHRGLVPEFKDLLKGDSALKGMLQGVFSGVMVVQQAWGYEATRLGIEKAKANGYSFSVTGHGVGGWLAELSTYYCHWDFAYRGVRGVVFDSPGGYNMLEKFKSNVLSRRHKVELEDIDLISYLSAPNLINTCGKHVGRVYRLPVRAKEEEKAATELGGIVGYASRAVAGFKNSYNLLQAHALDKLIEEFAASSGKPKAYEEVIDWPYIERRQGRRDDAGDILDLIPFMQAVPSVIKNALVNRVVNLFSGTTVYAVGDVILAVLSGEVDAAQYWDLLKYLDSKKGYELKTEELDFKDSYAVSYASHYKVKEVSLTEDILMPEKKLVDWYLQKLSVAKFEASDLNQVLKVHLSWLRGQYKLRRNEESQLEITGAIAIEDLRVQMGLLLQLSARVGEVLGASQVTASDKVAALQRLGNLAVIKRDIIACDEVLVGLDKEFSKKQVVLLSGVAGSGKSTVAEAYALGQGVAKTVVCWLRASVGLASYYQELAAAVSIDAKGLSAREVKKRVHLAISEVPYVKVLEVIDGVEDVGELDFYLSDLPKNMQVLLTGRNGELAAARGWGKVELGVVKRAAACSYVGRQLPWLSESAAAKLVDSLGLVAERLAAGCDYLAKHKLVSVEDYVAGVLVDSSRWRAGLSGPAIALVEQCAVVAPSFMTVELLKRLGFRKLEENLQELTALSIISVVQQHEQLGLKLSEGVQKEVRDTISKEKHSKLQQQSAVELETMLKAVVGIEQLKRFMQLYAAAIESIKDNIADAKIKLSLSSKLALYYGCVLLQEEKVNLLQKQIELILAGKGIEMELAARVYTELGKALYSVGQLEMAKNYFTIAKSLSEEIIEEKASREALISYVLLIEDLALVCYELRDYEQALAYNELILTKKEELYSKDNIEIAISLVKLGDVAFALNKLALAQQCWQQALELYAGREEIEYGQLLVKLAHVAIEDGYFSEASTYLKAAKEWLFAHCKAIDASIGLWHEVSGYLYHGQGDAQKAKFSLKRAVDIYSKLYAPSKIEVARVNDYLGQMYYQQGDIKQAREYWQQVVTSDEKLIRLASGSLDLDVDYLQNILSSETPLKPAYMGRVHANLGQALYRLDRVEAASEHLKSALSLYRSIYPAEHIEIIKLLDELGNIYYQQGDEFEFKVKLALECWQEVQRLALSNEQVKSYFAGVVELSSSRESLISYLEATKQLHKHLYKSDNYRAVLLLDNLASLYFKEGIADKSIELWQEGLSKSGSYIQRHTVLNKLYSHLGNGLCARREYTGGIALLETALFNQVAVGASSKMVRSALFELGEYYKGFGYAEKGEACIRQASKEYKFIPGSAVKEEELVVLQKLLKNCIPGVLQAASHSRWEDEVALKLYTKKGVKSYLDKEYLTSQLGAELGSEENIKVSRRLCLEAVSIALLDRAYKSDKDEDKELEAKDESKTIKASSKGIELVKKFWYSYGASMPEVTNTHVNVLVSEELLQQVGPVIGIAVSRIGVSR